ncbi:unnamed protein product [Callosobruchus maculatus]|uniref:Uncharacterized protein n=1 Tax=Callosobruchus maculatus TaxID=64391 RepID=A0A653BHX8_CALMS|nr:unnamed protein product [Callosobruchus maculatus]
MLTKMVYLFENFRSVESVELDPLIKNNSPNALYIIKKQENVAPKL